MQNIIELTSSLINERGMLSTPDIAKEIKEENLLKLSTPELLATICMDLQMDGRFICIDRKWDFKINYTMQEVIREQYKNTAIIDIFEEEEEDLDIELNVDNKIDIEDDNVIDLSKIEELN